MIARNAMDTLIVDHVQKPKVADTRRGDHSYWGQVQHVTKIADGIEFVSTAGHGGFKLSPDRQQVLAERCPNFRPFTGSRQWLEEDCDAMLAPLLFPDCFKAETVASAKQCVASMKDYFADCQHLVS